MKHTTATSIVRIDHYGVTYCGKCRIELLCDCNGDMPDTCPGCGRKLDWTQFDRWAERLTATDTTQPKGATK